MWTHIFDLLAKALSLAFVVVMFTLGSPNSLDKNATMILVLSFVAAGVLWWIALRPLSSWMHARVRLGARLSWDQARRASMMFSPVRLQDLAQWHPLWEERQLPAETRVAAIEAAMSQLLGERAAETARWQVAPAVSHLFRWLRWGVATVIVVLTLANLPTASWVSEFQARGLDGKYYPVLTAFILLLPGVIVLAWLESLFGARSVTLVSNPPLPDETEAAAPNAPEKEPRVDPDDHSRFSPPPGVVSPRQE